MSTETDALWPTPATVSDHPLSRLSLRDYAPRRAAQVAASTISRPRFPVIDAHNHLGRWLTGTWTVADPAALVDLMDELDISTIVNLDGRWGDEPPREPGQTRPGPPRSLRHLRPTRLVAAVT